MNTKEFVEEYVNAYKSNSKKFVVVQLIIDIILIAIYVFAIIKFADSISYISASVILIVFSYAAISLNMKKTIGGFKEFGKASNIKKAYNDAVKEFNDTGDKRLFDEKLAELELKIKEK